MSSRKSWSSWFSSKAHQYVGQIMFRLPWLFVCIFTSQLMIFVLCHHLTITLSQGNVYHKVIARLQWNELFYASLYLRMNRPVFVPIQEISKSILGFARNWLNVFKLPRGCALFILNTRWLKDKTFNIGKVRRFDPNSRGWNDGQQLWSRLKYFNNYWKNCHTF